MVMRIWFACTKLLRQRKTDESCIFQSLIDRGCIYSCENKYLGKEGKLVFPNENIIVKWCYTARDGFFTQLKRKNPYRIIFEYNDGNSFINDDRECVCDSMKALRDDLEKLRDEVKKSEYINAYDKMESILLKHLKDTIQYTDKSIFD